VPSALPAPGYWQTLARGVVSGVEHGPAFIGYDFATVLDVGANKGQYAAFARRRWPQARLICFEPLPGRHGWLVAILGTDEQVHPVAVGNCEGCGRHAHRLARGQLVPFASRRCSKIFFSMDEECVVSVPVRRLDTEFRRDQLARPAMLKIDAQGFEFETLQGTAGVLDAIDATYFECSFLELYSGQKLAADVIEYLKDVQADLLFQRVPR
jgi:FkbM family methyltransferase